jgi:hypothetical protein
MLLNFSSIIYLHICMASPKHPPYSPRRPEGGRSPRLALPPFKPCLRPREPRPGLTACFGVGQTKRFV